MDTARGDHDLNGVKVLEIHGWPGRHNVKARTDGGTGVTIEAPERDRDGFWTFARTTLAGVLSCHTSLLGSPTLAALGGDQTLTVFLPADKISTIQVQLV
jgi:hypothetical protein